MEFEEGKKRFIESWGQMAGGWGISPAMAQVHALLMVAPEPVCAEHIRQELDISVGNVSMNLRALMDWGLVFKDDRCGCRKEYYYAEKDIWKVFRQIILNRKKRELEPMIQLLDELASVNEACPHSASFCQVIHDIRKLSHRANTALDLLAKTDSNPVLNVMINLAR